MFPPALGQGMWQSCQLDAEAFRGHGPGKGTVFRLSIVEVCDEGQAQALDNIERRYAVMAKMEKRNSSQPDETRTFDNGRLELVTVGGVTFGRATFQPGWKWSTSVKPLVKTESCEAPHIQYHVSGRIHVVMDDGSEEEFGPGDVSDLPPGHDAWVVGDDPVVVIDVSGMGEYAKPK